MAIADILDRLQERWAIPRSATHRGKQTLFLLRCDVDTRVAEGDPGVPLPSKLAEFWRQAAGARLFEDEEYGQWGLILLRPEEAAVETGKFRRDRLKDYINGDLVIGRFLGDQELLLVRCDPDAEDYGRVLVVLPLDSRGDWYEVAPDFSVFLEEYEHAEGAKYWE